MGPVRPPRGDWHASSLTSPDFPLIWALSVGTDVRTDKAHNRPVAGCCDPKGCDQIFGPRFARHVAARYRKRGLDRASQRMVDWLKAQGIDGASILEIGGGVGEIQLELLRHGAARTTNLELSPAYDAEAAVLASDAGVGDRMTRRLGDIAVDDSVADVHDYVVMHRVVCCYPDVDRLLGAAASHARRGVVLTHPPRNVVTRVLRVLEDMWLGLLGREYRAYAHPPEVMEAVLRQYGFEPARIHRGLPWRVLAATPRVTSPA